MTERIDKAFNIVIIGIEQFLEEGHRCHDLKEV